AHHGDRGHPERQEKNLGPADLYRNDGHGSGSRSHRRRTGLATATRACTIVTMRQANPRPI
ncbi:MAG TPA: hypothetical protein VI011_10620, partial [Asanoa sp.]